jgi:hypothetical protein
MTPQTTAPLPPPPQDQGTASLIQAHLAEYSMLTTRATYSIAFCTAVWALLGGYLALMVNMARSLKQNSLLQWVSVIAIEMMLAWIATFILDQYVTVLYLETELSPILAGHFGENRAFWKWERFIARRRGKYLPLFWEWTMSIFSGIAITVILIWHLRFGWALWDVLAFPAIFLLYFNVVLARNIQKTREEWTQFNTTWERRSGTSTG